MYIYGLVLCRAIVLLLNQNPNNMAKTEKTYDVTLTCIYNGCVKIKASSEDEAIRKANEMLDSKTLKDFPDRVELPDGCFQFGEATADYADEYDDD